MCVGVRIRESHDVRHLFDYYVGCFTLHIVYYSTENFAGKGKAFFFFFFFGISGLPSLCLVLSLSLDAWMLGCLDDTNFDAWMLGCTMP